MSARTQDQDQESQPLLNRPTNGRSKKLQSTKTVLIILFATWAILASIWAVIPIYKGSARYSRPAKKNVIFFVSDGMGPASLSLSRSFKQIRDGLEMGDILTLDEHMIGHVRTRSASSLVTDSAAGATAYSCGFKTTNEQCAVLADGRPCGTILEAAKLNHYLTGMVVTTDITDATPASYASHVVNRFNNDLVAEHEVGLYPLGRVVDLLIGGGLCHFLPTTKGGCRRDNKDLVSKVVDDGWSLARNRKEYDLLRGGDNVTLPLFGLLAHRDIPFDLDRLDEVYPSLEDTATTAMNALAKASREDPASKGFFLLVEGSRIDHAGHAGDPAAQANEVLAYDDAFKAALKFAKHQQKVYGVETLILATSDHETGGLSIARQLHPSYPQYLWHPEVLINASHTSEYLGRAVSGYNGKNDEKFVETEIVKKGLGIADPDEIKAVVQRIVSKKASVDFVEEPVEVLEYNTAAVQQEIANIISERAQIGWSTHGHTAVDVNLYAYGSSEYLQKDLLGELIGSNENTDLANYIVDYLKLDLDAVTESIQDTNTH